MRHVLANAFTYGLVAALALGSALWAWARSEQLVVAREVDVEPTWGTADTGLTMVEMLAFGERVYRANCQNCHTVDGSGRGMYPPVQNQAAHLQVAGGRGYLIDLALYGLHSGTYRAPMPPMPELSDAEVAATTNYILAAFAAEGRSLDSTQLLHPREVAVRRGRALGERDVAAMRPPVPTAKELGRGVWVPIGTDAPAVPEGQEE